MELITITTSIPHTPAFSDIPEEIQDLIIVSALELTKGSALARLALVHTHWARVIAANWPRVVRAWLVHMYADFISRPINGNIAFIERPSPDLMCILPHRFLPVRTLIRHHTMKLDLWPPHSSSNMCACANACLIECGSGYSVRWMHDYKRYKVDYATQSSTIRLMIRLFPEVEPYLVDTSEWDKK